MAREIAEGTTREAPTLRPDTTVSEAVTAMRESDMPALAVTDTDGKLMGIFGFREFISALFPGYLGTLHSASFLTGSLDDALEKRSECAREPIERWMLTEHVEAPTDCSDVELAEIFLHHPSAVVPIVDSERRVSGYVTQRDFFDLLTGDFLRRTDA
jgi:CBS domain-containing protein